MQVRLSSLYLGGRPLTSYVPDKFYMVSFLWGRELTMFLVTGNRSSIDDGARSDGGLDDETVEPDQGNGKDCRVQKEKGSR